MEISELLQKLDDPSVSGWVVISALVIGALVRMSKAEKLGGVFHRIPARYRSMIPVALGAMSGGLEMLLRGASYKSAAVHAVIAFSLAISGHEVLIKGLRDGRELGEKKSDDEPAKPRLVSSKKTTKKKTTKKKTTKKKAAKK